MADPRVTVSKNGPYLVTGNVPLATQTVGADAFGNSQRWLEGNTFPEQESYALCRCGQSQRKPYCDGYHARVGFDGTETASRGPTQAKAFDGPELRLGDAEALCAGARFCDPNGGVWKQVEASGDADTRAALLRQVGNCPSGRLVAIDQETGLAVEPELPVSIGLVEDPQEGCSGPLWLRGGIAVIAADGYAYAMRNRITLCRCGASRNKPFCDGTHAAIKFRDW